MIISFIIRRKYEKEGKKICFYNESNALRYVKSLSVNLHKFLEMP